ncbi:hypothetical protein ACTHAM_001785 [Cellulomonas soli]|uniref:hypothetical protein n=1 Tax=Cellulomonas soli TaxID=931535 RepID=UPI003F84425A
MTGPVTGTEASPTAAEVDPRFERSVGRWLRAYPRRWRVARAAELTAVLADLAAPGATRLDLRSALGLLRSGWATRWRERPPIWVQVGYRWQVSVPAPRYRPWVRDDIEGTLFPLRDNLWRIWFFIAMLGYLVAFGVYHPGIVIGYLLLVGAVVGLRDTRARRTAAKRALQASPYDAPGQWGLIRVSTLRDRWVAAPVLVCSAGALAIGALGWGAAASIRAASTDLAVAVTAALVVGAVLALVVVRRLLRELPHAPAQPSRRLVRPSTANTAGAAAVVALVVGEACLEAVGEWPMVLAPYAGPLCLLLLVPVAAAAWVVRGAHDVTVVDVRRVALTGRTPALDSLTEGLVGAYRAASTEADLWTATQDEPAGPGWVLGSAG